LTKLHSACPNEFLLGQLCYKKFDKYLRSSAKKVQKSIEKFPEVLARQPITGSEEENDKKETSFLLFRIWTEIFLAFERKYLDLT